MNVLTANIPLWVFLVAAGLYYLFAAYAGSLEMPTQDDSRGYKQWFKFVNSLAANLSRAATAAKIPHVD